MSTATLTVTPLPALHPTAEQIVIDCGHATTRAVYAVAVGGYPLTRDEVICWALARHFGEEGCGCIRSLWRRYWQTELGAVPLARGSAR
jgi:hypothetical protein